MPQNIKEIHPETIYKIIVGVAKSIIHTSYSKSLRTSHLSSLHALSGGPRRPLWGRTAAAASVSVSLRQ